MKHLIHVYRACVQKLGERDVYATITIVLFIDNVLERYLELKKKIITSYELYFLPGYFS